MSLCALLTVFEIGKERTSGLSAATLAQRQVCHKQNGLFDLHVYFDTLLVLCCIYCSEVGVDPLFPSLPQKKKKNYKKPLSSPRQQQGPSVRLCLSLSISISLSLSFSPLAVSPLPFLPLSHTPLSFHQERASFESSQSKENIFFSHGI